MPRDNRPQAYADLYLSLRAAEGLSARTLDKYRQSLDRFLSTELPADVRDLDAIHAANWLAGMRANPRLNAGGISTYQRSVWTWLRWLFEQKYVPADISRQVKPVHVLNARRRTASEDAYRAMITVALARVEAPKRDAAIIEFLWSTGARRNELTTILLEDVDFELGTVRLTRKGGKVGTIAVGTLARHRLLDYRMSERGSNPGPLFLARNGGPMSNNALRLVIQRLAHDAGVTVSSHDFRRAFAARLLREGMALDNVARLMGHAGTEMTLLYGEEGRTERAVAAYHAHDAGVRPIRKGVG